MEGELHTWPKDQKSWRGVCQGWLEHHLQNEVGVHHVTIKAGEKQVRIKEGANLHQIDHQKGAGPQQINRYMGLDLLLARMCYICCNLVTKRVTKRTTQGIFVPAASN